MKIRYIPYLTIVLAAFLLSACHSIMDDDVCTDQPSDTTTPVQIGFTLTTGDVSSRAITEGEEAGTGHENYIDIANNNFRILLFNTDNKYLTALKVNRITQTGNDGTTYYVEGELDKAYTDFKLVVLANWGETYADNWTSETTIADVCKATYSYSSSFNINNDLIPMYGVQTYSDVEFRADLLTELPTDIALLRAMAKIEVTCNATDIVLTGATLYYYNTSGHCAPTNVYSNTATDWDWDNDEVCHHAVHIPTDVSSADNLPFTPTDEGYIVYVPEFDNTGVETKSFISVSLEHADGTEVNLDNTNIYFGDYTDEGTLVENTDFDIVRNHWYKYDITNVDDGELIFQYRVMKWNVESSAIGWDVTATLVAWDSDNNYSPSVTDATAEGGGDEEAIYCYVVNPRYNSAHNGLEPRSSYAGFYFLLNAPDGAVWKAHLDNDNFEFGTGQYTATDSEGNSYQRFCTSTGIARDYPYQIQIKAKNAWTETDFNTLTYWGIKHDGTEIKTKFWITVSLDGIKEYKLKINPKVKGLTTYYNTGRRFAGDNDYEITIWQLKALASPNDLIELLEHYNYNKWWIKGSTN